MIKLKTVLNETQLEIQKYNITFNKDGKLFTVDMANIKQAMRYQQSMKDPIVLWNKDSGKSMEYKFNKIDYSGAGEDREIAGWNYTAKDGKSKLLIIND